MLIWHYQKVGQGKKTSCPDFLFPKCKIPHIRKMGLKDIINIEAIPLVTKY